MSVNRFESVSLPYAYTFSQSSSHGDSLGIGFSINGERFSFRSGSLDAFTFLPTLPESSGSPLPFFTFLHSRGIRSSLVDHFRLCESVLKGYTLPPVCDSSFSVSSLFVRDLFYFKEKVHSQYRLVGGHFAISAILSFDPFFFLALCHASDLGYCRVRRLDICSDFSDTFLMDCVSLDICDKRASTSCGYIRGFGRLSGFHLSDKAVHLGPFSSFIKNFDKSSILSLDSCYFGSRRSSLVICIYNKRLEQLYRKRSFTSSATRFEVRFFQKAVDSSNALFMRIGLNSISYNLLSVNDLCVGAFIRHILLTVTLFSKVQFKRGSSLKGFTLESDLSWSNWYKQLYSVCVESLFCTDFRFLLTVRSSTEFFSTLKAINEKRATVLSLFEESLHLLLLNPSVKAFHVEWCRLIKGKGDSSSQSSFSSSSTFLSFSSYFKSPLFASEIDSASKAIPPAPPARPLALIGVSPAAPSIGRREGSLLFSCSKVELSKRGRPKGSVDSYKRKVTPFLRSGRPKGRKDSYKRKAITPGAILGRPKSKK